MGRRCRGFSLVEMMVATLIVSLLLVIALPAYREQVLRSRRAVAAAELRKVAVRQELYFIEQRRYAPGLAALGYPADVYGVDAHGAIHPRGEGGNIYLVQLSTASGYFSLQAAPLGGDARCGTLSLDALGITAASGPGGARGCW